MSFDFQGNSVHFASNNKEVILTFNEIAEGWSAHVSGDPLTRHVADFSQSFVERGMPECEAFLVVRMVCAWGGLRGDNPEKIKESVFQPCRGTAWLRDVIELGRSFSLEHEYEKAIEVFDEIQGLGISFRSKILRFICPDDAAVLDSVIRKRLGYPHSVAGYRAFVTDCKAIRDQLNSTQKRPDGGNWRTTDVEMGVFKKVKS